MEHDKDCICHLCLPGTSELRMPCKEVPPPNPPPAGDKEEPTTGHSQDFVGSAQSNEGNAGVARDNGGRDYTRAVYQNLMAVVELFDKRAPLPVSQKQIQEALGLSKGVVFDICWNLRERNWAEDVGGGMMRIKKAVGEKELLVGRMVMRGIKDIYGFEI